MAAPFDRLHRRALLGAGVATLCGAGAQTQGLGRLAFAVWRNGRQIGEHTVELRESGAGRTAQIAATLLVKLGPVPVFRYHHEATETWSAPEQFAALEARTVSNGKVDTVSARSDGGGVRIARSGGADVAAPARAAPLTHWNRDALSRPLFNPQTGVLVREAVVRRPETVTFADGRTTPATAFVLTGDAQITDWYDASGTWVALRGKVSDGSFLEYRRLS